MLEDLPQDVYLVKILSFNFATVPLTGLVCKWLIFFLKEDAPKSDVP